MEIKGIDVSAWQENINWDTVADYGMGFAILRITENGNVTDKYFEKKLYGVPETQYSNGSIQIFLRNDSFRD